MGGNLLNLHKFIGRVIMLKVFICALLVLAVSASAFAHNHVWYDKTAGIDKLKKVAIFPLKGEKNFIGAEDLLKDSLTKNAKDVYFMLLTPDNQYMSLIGEQNKDYVTLLNDFTTEAAIGQTVKEKTGADAYLVCNIRENRVQQDWSPEKICEVDMRSYTETVGGAEGYRRYNESSWTELHTIPGQYVYLNFLDLEYTLYDTQGNKIMLLQHRTQGYDTNEEEQFRSLLTEFAKEFKRVRKNKEK